MEIKEYLDKYGIVGVVSNYKISLDLDSTVSDLNIKNFEKACKMVKIDGNILNKKLSELSVSELFKVEFMSKLDKKVIIIGNMSSRLILKDIEYFKKLIIKLNSEYNKKFVIIDKDISVFFDLVKRVFVVNSKKVLYSTSDFFDDKLYRYASEPQVVKFIKCVNKKKKILKNNTDILEVLKDIYRSI